MPIRTEEQWLSALRHRPRAITYFFMILVMSILLTFILTSFDELDSRVTPERLASMLPVEELETKLPFLISHCYVQATAKAKLLVVGLFLSACIGLLMILLVIELLGAGKDRLLILLLEKTQSMQKEMERLALRTEGGSGSDGAT